MSPKLREQLAFTLGELARLRKDFGDRILGGVNVELTDDECIVLSTALHGFYNLCEGMLKAIAAEFDEVPTRPDWHSQLLAAFADGQSRSGLDLPSDLRLRLAALMRFRHVFRHVYVLDIDAERLRPLLTVYESVDKEFDATLRSWLGGGLANQESLGEEER